MGKIKVSDLVDSFEKAIIIDIKERRVYSIKDGGIKIYPDKFYDEILSGLNYMDFGDDK